DTTKKDGTFNYSFVSSEKNDVNTTLRLSRFGFYDSVIAVTYGADKKAIGLNEIRLKGLTAANDSVVTGKPSLRPGVVVYLTSTFSLLSIRGAGANDATNLTFEVRDSLGNPVDDKNKATVKFLLISKPDSLTELNRAFAVTNSSGQVIVQLTAGLKAGIAQVQAFATVKNAIDSTKLDTIRSQVVSLPIAGGLPAQSGISIGPAKFNIAGGIYFNLRNTITAVVADTFGNPVQKGTIVYFTTNGGSIQPSGATSQDGIVSADLITGNPFPPAGIATITASIGTAGGSATAGTAIAVNEKKVDEKVIVKNLRNIRNIKKNTVAVSVAGSVPLFSKTTRVLFSGPTNISLADSNFSVAVGSYRDIPFTVGDPIGNPLTDGTTISVKVEPADVVDLTGDKDIKIPDTMDKQWTQFKVSLRDKRTTAPTQSVPLKLTINVESGNGRLNKTISGFLLGTGGVTIDSSIVGRIELVNPQPDTLLIASGGTVDSKEIAFKVFNTFGFPAKNVAVSFTISKALGGGEYVSPSIGVTDDLGIVKTTIHSSVKVGELNVIATAQKDTVTISSSPKLIRVVIPKGSRLAAQINFLNISKTDIDIAGVGGIENSEISYQVLDALGFPIDKERRAFASYNLRFEPSSSAGGGTPSSLISNGDSTDDNGKLTARIVSGTQAGVITIQVGITLPGKPPIYSTPVKLTVHAGFADQGHFTFIPEHYVFAGFIDGIPSTGFSVQVGDTFSNPVKAGTALIFSTQAGVMQTGQKDFSAYTDVNGIAKVLLFPNKPTPDDAGTIYAGRPTFDTTSSAGRRGYHWVWAQTQGKYGNVKDSILVVQAQGPVVIGSVPVTIVNIDSVTHQSVPISITVKDVRGNPLPDGTKISVSIQNPPNPPNGFLIDVTGNIGTPTILPRAQYARFPGSGITDFTFRVIDASTFQIHNILVKVIIAVDAPGIGLYTQSFQALVQ
ncbi:MAG: hypothetical protein PHP42_12050, partial [Bacteroidota bacterium]|nr:hypothetical protein [Bacteroidota bacterium]